MFRRMEPRETVDRCPGCDESVGVRPAVLPGLRDEPRRRRQPDGHRPAPRRPAVGIAVAPRLRRSRSASGAARALRARHGAPRPLSHRRPDRPRRHGRGLPGRRPEARAAGRAEVPAARARERPGAAGAALQRGAPRATGLPPGGLPRVGRRRGRRAAVPLDGVRGRREPRRRCCAASAGCPSTRRSTSRGRSPPASPPRTRRASCTATSSPRT